MSWIQITPSHNIPVREGRAVRIAGRDLAIFHLPDRFVAIDNACPHQGGPLCDGIVSGTTVVCPLHGWKFSLESGASSNVPECLQTYPARVENGVVCVDISKIINAPLPAEVAA